MGHVRQALGVTERRPGKVLGQHRSAQRKVPRHRENSSRL